MSNNAFGMWLKKQLIQQNISYRAFEKETGISRSNLSLYINGFATPTRKPIVIMANFFAQFDASRNYYIILIIDLLELEA